MLFYHKTLAQQRKFTAQYWNIGVNTEGNTVSLLFQNRCKLEGFANLIFSGTFLTLHSTPKRKGKKGHSIICLKPYDAKNKLTFWDVIRSL